MKKKQSKKTHKDNDARSPLTNNRIKTISEIERGKGKDKGDSGWEDNGTRGWIGAQFAGFNQQAGAYATPLLRK